MYKIILLLHIVAGATALTSMWVPMIATKGGRLHRRAGWVFTGAMAAVASTAFVMSTWLMLIGDVDRGLRLVVIGLLATTAVSSGIRVLQFRRRELAHRGKWELSIASALMIAACVLGWWGLRQSLYGLVALAVVGFIYGAVDLGYWLRTPSTAMHWWIKHMGGMLTACLIATGAILSNLAALGVPQNIANGALTLLVPGLIGARLWRRYYDRKFSVSSSAAAVRAAVQ